MTCLFYISGIYDYYLFNNAFYWTQHFNDRKVKFANFNIIRKVVGNVYAIYELISIVQYKIRLKFLWTRIYTVYKLKSS